MKSFLKKNWKWLVPVVVLVVLLAAVLIPYHFGVRITYDPALMTDWNATSAIASWVGVLVSIVGVAVSGLAIWYAIQVPKKIAARQDKIALFEKRHECYRAVQNVIQFSRAIKKEYIPKNIKNMFATGTVVQGTTHEEIGNVTVSDVYSHLAQLESVVTSIDFLFSGCKTEILVSAVADAESLAISVFKKSDDMERLSWSDKVLLKSFVEKTESFETEYLPIMEKALDLKDIK